MTKRIGEILLSNSVITPDELDRALRVQVIAGARLGTNLVDLFQSDLDAITAGLAEQHGLPPAKKQHLEQVDKSLLPRLSPTQAESWQLIPLWQTGDTMAVATMSPLSRERKRDIESFFHCAVAPHVAAELRIHYYLEHLYGIERPNRFRRIRPSRASEPPQGVGERRNYASSLGDPEPSSEKALGKMALTKSARKIMGELDDTDRVQSVDEALSAMRRATGRDRIARIVVSCLHDGFDGCVTSGLLFVVRDRLAICWQGFSRNDEVDLAGLAVPLDTPGVLGSSARSHAPFFGVPEDARMDQLLWRHLACGAPKEVAVFPVEIYESPALFLYAQTSEPLSDDVRQGIRDLGEGMTRAFRRLVRALER